MNENERQRRMMERIQEDERLRGDLEDDAASALISWAGERASAAAADPTRPDDAVEAEVQAIRKAAGAAARAGAAAPARLIALAEAELAKSVASSPKAAPQVAAETPAAAIETPALPGKPAARAPLRETATPAPSETQRADRQPRSKRSRLAAFLKHRKSSR